MRKKTRRLFAFILTLCMVQISVPASTSTVSTCSRKVNEKLSYLFTGGDATAAGYAEGTIVLQSTNGGNYYLYWADNQSALSGYYEITSMKINKGGTSTFTFGYHTVIPADATKIIAIKSDKEPEKKTVANATAVYKIPVKKQLVYSSKDVLYRFHSFSDIHIDEEHWGSTPAYYWLYSEQHWAQALEYATEKKVDFIISSGDQVTNASFANLDKEWKVYQNILSQSDYVNPIWESGGNHEVRQDGSVLAELNAYAKGTGLDNTADTIGSGKSYYSITEPTTGDLFIFMSLESGYRPAKYDEFSDEQMNWLEEILEKNYGMSKNIYLIQHALISGYGAGDDIENPYYGGSINPELKSAQRFKTLIEKYSNIIWISGHSHEDYSLGNNYSNNNGTSCNMIHNSSVANPTHISKTEEHALDYSFEENLSQGYYVETYKDAILFYGANLCDRKIYPAYCYIINGNTSKQKNAMKDNITLTDKEVTSGMINSLLANTKSILGVNYEYSSYDQYQTLKKYYYRYKKIDTTSLSETDLKLVYSQLSSGITALHDIVQSVVD